MRPRATIAIKRLKVVDRAPDDYWRPTTRGDCSRIARPCLYVTCRHHLYLDVKPNGNIRLNFPHLQPSDLTDSCSLDVADKGDHSLMRVGDALGVTREMIRQMEAKIFALIQALVSAAAVELDELNMPEGHSPSAWDGLGRSGADLPGDDGTR